MGTLGWVGWIVAACAPPVATDEDTVAVEEALSEPAAPPSSGAGPTCGSVLTRSTKLRADIGPCTGDGLVLGANDLTLDCDGHTLRGTHPWTGIVSDGRADVHIRNCRIEGFAVGISMHEAIGGAVEGNRVRCRRVLGFPATPGMSLADAVGVRVERNDVRGCFAGIVFEDSTVLDVVGNTVTDADYGIRFEGDIHGVRVSENRVRRAESSLLLGGNVVGNRFEENEFSDGLIGVFASDTQGNRYAHNFVHDMHIAGFNLSNSRSEVFEHNVVVDNDGWGFWAGPDATRNHFEDNEVYDNDREGFVLALGADDNVLEDNQACGNDSADAAQEGGMDNRLIDNDFCIVTGF